MTLEEIVSEAESLDDEARASLASRLLRTLPPPGDTVTDEEVHQRMKEAEEDPSVMLSREEFLAGITQGES